jgi:hypothetical protein
MAAFEMTPKDSDMGDHSNLRLDRGHAGTQIFVVRFALQHCEVDDVERDLPWPSQPCEGRECVV